MLFIVEFVESGVYYFLNLLPEKNVCLMHAVGSVRHHISTSCRTEHCAGTL